MNQLKNSWIRDYRIAAVLAAITGILVYIVAGQFSEHMDVEGPSILYGGLAGTILAAFIFGMIYPRAAWQWGIYVLLGQIAFTFIFESGDMNQFPLGVALYMILLIPMLLAGALGGYIARKTANYKSPGSE